MRFMGLPPRASLLAVLALTASGLSVVGVVTAPAQALTDGPRWCSASPAPPCVEHLYVDGVEKFDGDPTYDVQFAFFAGGPTPSEMFQYYVQKSPGGYKLGASTERFTVVLDSGSLKPRVVDGWASEVVVTRDPDPAGVHHHVTVSAKPSEHLAACRDIAGTLTCPFTAAAAADDARQVGVTIDDGSWWGANPDQVNGLEYFTNIDVGGIPPEFVTNSATGEVTLSMLMANAHARADGSTYFGRSETRLPNRFMREVYGIPDPSTMTGTSLVASVSGGVGTANIYQESGADAMRIDVTGVTFSKRHLRVSIGTIRPTKPTLTKTKRISGGKGRVTFTKARPRGAKVTGYQAKCVSGRQVVTDRGGWPSFVVSGLRAGRGYDCRVRALSKAGPGRYSAKKHLAARP